MAIVRVATHGSFNGLPNSSGAGLAPPPGAGGTINNRIAVASPVIAGNFVLVFGLTPGSVNKVNLITDTRGNTYTVHFNAGDTGLAAFSLFFAVGEIVTPLQTGDFIYINRALDRDLKCVVVEYSGLRPHGDYWLGNASRAWPGSNGAWTVSAGSCGTIDAPPDSLVLGLMTQYVSYPTILTPTIVTPGAGFTNEAGVARASGAGDDGSGFDWVSAITSGSVTPSATWNGTEGGYGLAVALAPAVNPVRMTV